VSNTLGFYNPAFYANMALIFLKKRLGLANRVHVGYDRERATFNRGDTINIRRPGALTVSDGGSAAQDLPAESVTLTLNKWREVRFELTDKELAFTGPNTLDNPIINDHIAPGAYALADDIDQKLAELIIGVPHAYVEASAATDPTVAGIMQTWRQLFDLKCPMADEANMHFMIGGQEQAILSGLSAFSQWQGAGAAGVETQRTTQLGQRLGFQWFANQNRPTAAYANISDFAGAINNASNQAKGDTSIVVDGLGTSETYSKGTILRFTNGAESGNQYVLTADVTMSSGGGTLPIAPALRVGCLDDATFAIGDLKATNNTTAGTGTHDNVTNNLNVAFHRDFAGLAMARLPDFGEHANQLGIKAFSVQDPVTGLSVRARMHYVGTSSKIQVVLDTLYGVKIFNHDLACRYEVKNA